MKKFLTVTLLWLCWGFALGTVILLGPLRWTVDFGRDKAWSQNLESSTVLLYMAVLLVISFIIALISANIILGTRKGFVKLVVGFIPIAGAAVALYIFMNPSFINKNMSDSVAVIKEDDISTTFTLGPYPEPEKIKELKDRGYIAIVSLLHPAVIPFEPKLLEEEKFYCQQNGLQLIHIPFLPWISDNEASVNQLRELAKNAKGKYYIHCYLGKDRANVAKRIIEQENTEAKNEGFSTEVRSLDTLAKFERGKIIKLEDKVYLTPLPTKEEYFGYVLAAGFQQVTALLDLSNTKAKEVEALEQKNFGMYKIPYRSFNTAGITKEQMSQIVQTIKTMPKPILIYTYEAGNKEAKLFEELYKQSATQ